MTPGLVLEVVEAAEDYQITSTEFSEIMGTVSSIFVGAFTFGVLGMLIAGLTKGLKAP
jgi:hypothetical protein